MAWSHSRSTLRRRLTTSGWCDLPAYHIHVCSMTLRHEVANAFGLQHLTSSVDFYLRLPGLGVGVASPCGFPAPWHRETGCTHQRKDLTAGRGRQRRPRRSWPPWVFMTERTTIPLLHQVSIEIHCPPQMANIYIFTKQNGCGSKPEALNPGRLTSMQVVHFVHTQTIQSSRKVASTTHRSVNAQRLN